tara:strand:+ start:22 stop:273 length:252 start_codon:yes stop_codon:yes gene_type:complete
MIVSEKQINLLALELAEEKIFCTSQILWHEKYDRLVAYCRKNREEFRQDRFNTAILNEVNQKLKKLGINTQLKNLTQYIKHKV